jgi:outer membrane protein assembly factor BamB
MFTNLWQNFRVWVSKRWVLVFFIALVLLLWLVLEWLKKPSPTIIRTLGSSTQHVNVLWFKQNFFTLAAVNTGGVVYAMPLDRKSLLTFDNRSGTTLWSVKLPSDQSGVRDLHADQDTVFVVNTLSVYAYEAKTGELKWSTELGQGHVSIIGQLDSGVIRVYYGDQIYELDAGTGKTLSTLPKDSTVWISGNTVLKGTAAFDRQTGKLLWDHGPLFYLDEGVEPEDLGMNILLVAQAPGSSVSRGICALNLQTGQYSWCRSEEFNSMVAVDRQSLRGYVMRSDNVLLTINLLTGDVLGETSFLANALTPAKMGTFASIAVSKGVVVVSFSDSGQTFGLKFLP